MDLTAENEKYILKYLDENYYIDTERQRVLVKESNNYISPATIRDELYSVYGFEEDATYIILYTWLYQKGLKDIKNNWLSGYVISGTSYYTGTTYYTATTIASSGCTSMAFGSQNRANSYNYGEYDHGGIRAPDEDPPMMKPRSAGFTAKIKEIFNRSG